MRCTSELTVTTRERSVVTRRSSSHPVEREMAQVIGRHLQLEAVGCLAVGGPHDAGVVHQYVQAGMLAEEGLRRPPDRDQIGQVERQQLHGRPVELALELVAGLPRPLLVAAGQHDMRAVVGQRGRGGVADAAVGPGHEDHPPRQVADVSGAPRGAAGDLAAGDAAHAWPM